MARSSGARPRKEIDTWATPLVFEVNGRAQANRARHGARAQLRSRNRPGRVGERRFDDEPNPVAGAWDGLVFLMSGFRGNDLKAIRVADAKATSTARTRFVWTLDRDTPYVPSPAAVDGVLYFLKSNNGIVSALDARTGKPHYQNQRLDGVPNVFASPVAAKGRVYFPGREGTTLVINRADLRGAGEEQRSDDGFDASPALVDGEIFLRGYKYLYAIAQP
jgi:outer membrane protein assembly factor BamB